MANRYDVADAWKQGKACTAASLSTDGKRLKSFGLVIGTKTQQGETVVIPSTCSPTTMKYSRFAMKFADATLNMTQFPTHDYLQSKHGFHCRSGFDTPCIHVKTAEDFNYED